jgi:hypothetical protein
LTAGWPIVEGTDHRTIEAGNTAVPDEAQVVLAQLLETHGRELIHDPKRLRAMLADVMPGAPEAKRLVAAAEEGIPAQLLTAGIDPTGATRLQLTRRLEDDRDMTPEAAGWTVDAWAAALGVDLGGPVASGVGAAGGGMGDEVTRTVPSGPGDDLPPPPSRGWVWVAAAAAALVLAGIAFVVIAKPFGPEVGGNGEPTPTASPTAPAPASATESAAGSGSAEPSTEPSTEPPTPTPTPEANPMDVLLSWVPAHVRDSCTPSNYTDYGSPIAQVDCEVSGMDHLSYLLYPDSEAMRVEYRLFVRGERNAGDCESGDLPSERDWYYDGVLRGRYACFWSNGNPWVVWTANYADILAFAKRDDNDLGELYRVWALPAAEGPGPLDPSDV